MSTFTALSTPTITGEIDTDRVLVLRIDDPSQSTNTMNAAFGESLAQTVDWLEANRETFDGVIVTSGKDSFFSGGDLELLRDAGPDDQVAIADALDFTKDKFRRLEQLGKPVVAALGGTALGGGFEIALACHHRIGLNRDKSRFGLPEVTLGLLPGTGGVTRTVRMFGVVEALTRLVGNGQRYRPAEAFEHGLIDELVDTEEQLMSAARAWIVANPDAVQPWDRAGFSIPGGTAAEPKPAAQLSVLSDAVRKPVKGAPMPAPIAVIAAAMEGSVLDFESASLVETRHCTTLACGPISGNLIQSMFFDLGSIDKGGSRPADQPHRLPEKVLVIGAGTMGAALAYVVATAHVPVVLLDVSTEAAERGKDYARSVLGKAVIKGRTTQAEAEADAVSARITPSSDAADAEGCDLVVEAVCADQAVEQDAFATVEPYLTADALRCSNTSTLDIAQLSQGVSRPSDFIGTRFFSPADTMPLVEIAVGERTSDSALARAFDFVRSIGKTPIVVRDSHGSFTTRVIGRFMDEAISMVAEGVHPATVEQVALDAGYPPGALNLMGAGPVKRNHRAGHGISYEDMMDRMLVAPTLEAIGCLDEGVLRTVAEANIGSILGTGYPAWTGGVLQFVNQFDGGLPGFVQRADELRERYGDRFLVPTSLRSRTERYR